MIRRRPYRHPGSSRRLLTAPLRRPQSRSKGAIWPATVSDSGQADSGQRTAGE